MKVLGIIPSRYGSSRFPGKPLIDLKGKSMIQRVYEQSSKCKLFSKIIVATDDQRIFEHVQSFGGNVVMTAENHQSGTARCSEVIKQYQDYDIVVNIQGDEPLIRPEQLGSLIELFQDTTVEIGTIVKKMKDIQEVKNPNRIKVVLDKEGNGVYFSRSPIPHVANISEESWLEHANFYKHIGIYAWRRHVLEKISQLPSTTLERIESLEQLRWIYNGFKIKTVETEVETPNIDAPEDVDAVLKLIP